MDHPEQTNDAGLAKAAAFEATHWTMVMQAGGPDSTISSAARAGFCRTYWYPVYCFIRRLGHSPEDAQDLTQDFFARILERNYLQAADREKGKFRSFLLLLLKRFMANEWRDANRQKRGGGIELQSIDAEQTECRYAAEPADNATPEKAFERQWAQALIEQVFERTRDEYVRAGKAEVYDQLQQFLSSDEETTYPELAARLHMSENNLRVNIHRLRHRFREVLRAEVARTVAPAQVDQEVRDVFAALS